MVTAPAATPVTIPVEEPMPAIALLLLFQRPPVTASVSGVFAPAHIVDVPEMADGETLTVTVVVV